MTLETEWSQPLYESFRAALVLTGSVEIAERAVTNAIATLAPEWSAKALLVETARSAFEHDTFSGELSPILPLELQALFLLFPTTRYCFVLLALMGLGIEICSEILRLSKDEVKQAFHEALLDLPRAAGTFLTLRRGINPSLFEKEWRQFDFSLEHRFDDVGRWTRTTRRPQCLQTRQEFRRWPNVCTMVSQENNRGHE